MNHRFLLRSLALVAIMLTPSIASAEVVVTFDTDTESFVKNGDGNLAEWSTENGGSLKLEANGGWAGNTTSWGGAPDGAGGTTSGLQTDPAMWAELQLALVNGGTISYDVIINEADVTYGNAPGWFETVMIFNSAGGWDQQTVSHGLNGGSWPLAGGTFTDTVTFDILPGSATADSIAQVDDSGGWTNLHFGLNNEGGAATTIATVYFDNITISANAVPEPSSLVILAGLGLVGFVTRRRVS